MVTKEESQHDDEFGAFERDTFLNSYSDANRDEFTDESKPVTPSFSTQAAIHSQPLLYPTPNCG